MSAGRATIVWIRRDFRLRDHRALLAAARNGPVVPVFVRDEAVDRLGAAPKWRLGEAIAAFSRSLVSVGSRLVLRTGPAISVLKDVARETGAGAVHWQRAYDPESVDRDTAVKAALKAEGIEARSFPGYLLFEPWDVATREGGCYRVFTPFWKGVRGREVAEPGPVPKLVAPAAWPASERLEDLRLGAGMRRGGPVVARYVTAGEDAALSRLDDFVDGSIRAYANQRDYPAREGTSGLSHYLALGEISPARCWHAARRALSEGQKGAECFLSELVWREFAWHLAWHTPRLLVGNWRQDFDSFPWQTDARHPSVLAWQRGRTGEPFVDAAMREMYVTGRMHNRARMVVASYLTKHLLTDWKIGRDWFAECLVDWDPASNALGWQWTAGSGPDAAPYFRVFNPVRQQEKFDSDGCYVERWIAEGKEAPHDDALAWFEAIPRSWGLSPQAAYPARIVTPAEGRSRALAAYKAWKGG